MRSSERTSLDGARMLEAMKIERAAARFDDPTLAAAIIVVFGCMQNGENFGLDTAALARRKCAHTSIYMVYERLTITIFVEHGCFCSQENRKTLQMAEIATVQTLGTMPRFMQVLLTIMCLKDVIYEHSLAIYRRMPIDICCTRCVKHISKICKLENRRANRKLLVEKAPKYVSSY